MKKSLRTLLLVASSLGILAQNQNKEIIGFKNGQKISANFIDLPTSQLKKTFPTVKPQQMTAKANNIQVVTATRFTSSMNAFGVLISESKPLQFNPNVNAVTFIHRKSPTYLPSSNGNSGSIVGMVSVNNGLTWDSTCIWANSINLARYPQGGIYNPLGNTNKNNAYLLGMGPITGGSGWLGNWYASKSLNGAGNTTPGADQQAHLTAAPTIKKHDMSRYSFTSIDGGIVRSVATIVNDINATTFSAYGMRGAAIVKGQFNAGAFVWSIDSFIPCVMQRSDGSKYLNDIPLQAWNENGTIGYLAMLGVRCGANPCQKSYQPLVYKTTNSGASWSLLPANTYNNLFLLNRLKGINTNSLNIVPYFSNNEGWDATVDMNGDLHLVCTVVGAYSDHIDSLDYTYTFGIENYSYKSKNLNWPTIYDFKTNAFGWQFAMVDSMYSEGPSGNLGDPGYGSNPWTDGSGSKLDYHARIQVSRTSDGRKILYSWSESDTSLLGLKWNAFPDIMLRGVDMSIQKMTPTYNITGGVSIVNQNAFFHYMSNKAIGSSTTCIEIPFTTSYNQTFDGSMQIDHFYIKGAALCPTSFSLNPMSTGPSSLFYNTTMGGCTITGFENIEENKTYDFLIYPNPTSDNAELYFESKDGTVINFRIFDYTGKNIYSYTVKPNYGTNSITIDLQNLNQGIYLINMESENCSVTKKIIKE